MNHQFSLFGWQKPSAKVPVSKERIQELKSLIANGDGKTAAVKMRELREGLENFERKITNGKKNENPQ